VRAGRLRHLVQFQRATETSNTLGEPVQTWATISTDWCAVEPLRGNEKFEALQVQTDIDTRIITRWHKKIATLTTKDRVLYGAIVYDIKEVLNIDQRNKELHIMGRVHA
jgi:SPP1 family predicted phage head-tail adaptor